MEVVIDGIVYVPKEKDKEVESIIVKQYNEFHVYPNELGKMNWEDAVKAVKELGNNWRLPTIEECFIMYNHKIITTGYYWSSTEYCDNFAYSFDFSGGYASSDYKTSTNAVRGVRTV